MRKARCGLSDESVIQAFLRGDSPCVYHPSQWSKTSLTFSFHTLTEDLTDLEIKEALRKAMGKWAAASSLTFSESASGDIRFSFLKGHHGDSQPFPNNYTNLRKIHAHAFPPPRDPRAPGRFDGEVHFNDKMTWVLGPAGGIDLVTVAIHELGHALGLGHSFKERSVMNDTYDGVKQDLSDDDKRCIRTLYGT